MNNMKERMEVNGTGGGTSTEDLIRHAIMGIMSARALDIKASDNPEKKAQEIDCMIQSISQEYIERYDRMSVGEIVFDSLMETVKAKNKEEKL